MEQSHKTIDFWPLKRLLYVNRKAGTKYSVCLLFGGGGVSLALWSEYGAVSMVHLKGWNGEIVL